MKEGPFAGPADIARFKREVQVLAQLQHPNIVTIHASGRAAGCFYFVMDYIPGESLDGYMAGADLTIEATLRLFAKICEAVNAAHLHGVIHRDLKPRNIRIDPSGQPHVLDFGLAKVAGAEVSEDGRPMLVSMTGQVLGSLPYMSPEQAEGQPSKIDVRTDVYSLGVILYQMLTRKLPYDDSGGLHAVLDRIIKTEPARPSTVRKEIDDEVDTIVLKCLAKGRDQRYQSAGELAREINHYLAGEPIEAKRDSGWYVLRKTILRKKVPLAVVTVFLISFVSSGIGFYYWRHAASQAAEKQFFAAMYFYGVADYKECALANRRGLEHDPENANAWFNLGLALEKLGDVPGAEDAFRRTQKLKPDDPWPMQKLAYVMVNQGRWEEALKLYQQLMRLDPDDHPTQLWTCIMFDRLGRTQEAIKGYNKFLQNNPNDLAALNNLARLYLVAPQAELRDPPKAIDLLKKSTPPASNASEFNITLAIAYIQNQRLPEAERLIENSPEENGRIGPIENLVLAMLARAKGDSEASEKYINKARPDLAHLNALEKVEAERILGLVNNTGSTEVQ